MARGHSGRIAIEVDRTLKRELYAALAMSGSTLKDWFAKADSRYCTDAIQPALFGQDSAVGGAGLQGSREDEHPRRDLRKS
jgi:hypothetical protein